MVLNGRLIFKASDAVVCKYCNREFVYHRSKSSMCYFIYHLRSNHPFDAVRDTSRANVESAQPQGYSVWTSGHDKSDESRQIHHYL